jgi:hypothetical protein
MHSRGNAELELENQGRFARPATIVGTTHAPSYPQLPASSPWSQPDGPPEPPLGFSVEEVPLVGEAFEIERSLRASIDAGSGGDLHPAMPSSPLTSTASENNGDGGIGDAPTSPLIDAGAGAATVSNSLAVAAPSTIRRRAI